MSNSWRQIKKAALKTGREAIVVDDDHILVVMTLARYDELLAKEQDIKQLSKEEFLEKINREIAKWHASQAEAEEIMISVEEKGKVKADKNASLSGSENQEEDDTFYVEPVVSS